MALNIPLTTVKSSAVTAYGYDAMSRTLAVRFYSGNLHHFHKVPLSVFEELKKAVSAGKFINENIRGKYDATPIDEDKKS